MHFVKLELKMALKVGILADKNGGGMASKWQLSIQISEVNSSLSLFCSFPYF
jgi:hypothetical protein